MLTIAPKMKASYDKKKNELRFTNLNYNILGYIAAGISLIAILAKGAGDTKASTKEINHLSQ
jgi:hypothetical protein